MSDDELQTALNSIPGYPEAAQAAATLGARKKQLWHTQMNSGPNPAVTHRQQFPKQLLEAAGRGLPDDLTEHDWGPGWQDSIRYAKTQLILQALTEAANHAENHRRHLLTQGANTALHHLNQRLADLLAGIRGSRATDDHAHTYRQIRQAQRAIFDQAHHSATRPQLNTVGEMADLFEHWPRWTKDGKPGKASPHQPAPWTSHGSDPDSCRYTADYLQWAVDNHVRLWVPTFPQMQAAATRDNRLREEQDIHRQNVNNGALPNERFTVPERLSLDTLLAEQTSKEPAHV